VEYIEENLKEVIDLERIASESALSPYHFHRLFNMTVGDTPGSYVRKRRLYQAAKELSERDRKVIDVALDYGYGSSDAFSRAFTKQFGFNPRDYRSNPNLLIRFPRPLLTLRNLNHIHGGVAMEPSIIEKPEACLVGVVYYGNNKEGEIPRMWENHFGEVASLSTRINRQGTYGFCFHNAEYVKNGLFYYMAAVEVSGFGEIPITAVAKRVPAHKYAVFTHTAEIGKLGETYEYIFGTWFPRKEYEVNESFDYEYYTTDGDGNTVVQIHVPIRDR